MEEKKDFRILSFLILLIIITSVTILFIRSFELMIIKGNWFFALSEENRMRKIRIEAARGEVVDRDERQLITNKVVYCQPRGDGDCLSIAREEALRLKAAGKTVETKFLRFYPLGSLAAHLTGYLGKIKEGEKLSCGSEEEENLNIWVGRGGIEEAYNCQLMGKDGWKLVEADATGNILRELGVYPASNGQKIKLTVNGWLQKIVGQTLGEQKGTVIILAPENGEVLALFSSPSFDPNKFTFERNDQLISQWLADEEGMPFLNRAISGAYHPGSVFKIITSIAGLESGKITAETLIEDTGVIKIGQWEYANWYWIDYGKKEGLVDIVKAIKRSNDIYFYKLGEKIGVEEIVKWASRFGVGKTLGIDLPAEVTGILPSPEWKREVKKEEWFLGNTYHLAIGQGDLTMTPLQVAVATAAIANGGKICRPHLILEDKVKEQSKSERDCFQLSIKPENLNLVKKGMIEACSTGGTGFPFFDFQPQVGCKTGTAEIDDDSNNTHAWFTAFVPADEPQMVMTVFLEKGGSGAYQAAPVAKAILEKYFQLISREAGEETK